MQPMNLSFVSYFSCVSTEVGQNQLCESLELEAQPEVLLDWRYNQAWNFGGLNPVGLYADS